MVTYKKGDTGDPLRARLYDEDGKIDLTDAVEVKVVFYNNGEETRKPVTIEDAEEGEIKYTWQSDDPIHERGTYRLMFEIIEPEDKKVTVPSEGWNSLRVE